MFLISIFLSGFVGRSFWHVFSRVQATHAPSARHFAWQPVASLVFERAYTQQLSVVLGIQSAYSDEMLRLTEPAVTA